ncbi:MAG: flagellar protein FlaG [Gammaproteobacteria bacterium]|jgi:flagellar protein FlaG
MVSEINSEDVFAISTSQTRAPEKVHPVNPAKPAQKLPDEGKELPPENRTVKEIDDAVKDINEHIQSAHRELLFSVDEDSGRTVIKVMDMNTKEVIRQIPNEEALKFARMLEEGADLELINTYI